ncbi:unnamed protein product [Ectocarpus sp. 13 AM-2016]
MEPAGDCEGVDSASDDAEIGEDRELEEFSKCVSAVRPLKCATLKVMRAWRTSYEDLKATRRLPGRNGISQTTNKWKDEEGNVQPPEVDCAFGTANRWKMQIDAVDKCHDRECCGDDTLLADATVKHPPPPTAGRNGGKTKSTKKRGTKGKTNRG